MVSDTPCHKWIFYALGLNPCSNGIWSLTLALLLVLGAGSVLILVLMEYGL